MPQRIDSTALADGTEIAYGVVGSGPVLMYVPGWLTHLELSWALPDERDFYQMLAKNRTLVRYDKAGCGLSGTSSRAPSMELELETLHAVAAAVGADRYEMLGVSLGAPVAVAWAASHQDDVTRLVLYGGWVRGHDLTSPETRAHLLGLIAQHWGLGSDLLAEIFAPDADTATREAFREYQRAAATPERARAMLELAHRIDVSDLLGAVDVPTLVVHRERDRATPLAQAEALAAGIPSASLAVLAGRDHLPYIGDALGLATCVRGFLGLPPAQRPVESALTPRQHEVAALVTEGLTNREIAARLSVSERTAESHVERIRIRLGFRSRAQIAAWVTAGGPDRMASLRQARH
ncbi:alpha/beta fold hydrolase [Nocardioides speluncae]|uniref:alpha/beta fold hydrolase n=1 Tax=Nocardioides speluncae TaxID=2670337 RepID=UPI000D69997A|nr:alpha/beta fold hydrolase [Nocardioides speluncae]